MYPPPAPYSPYAPQPVRRWWQHPALIIAALVLLAPVGVALVWMSPWSRGKKVVATVLGGLWFLLALLSDGDKKPVDDAKAKTAAAAAAPSGAASQSPTPAASAMPSPTAAAVPVMPALTGQPFRQAEQAVEALVEGELAARSAYSDVALPASYPNWVVCFQNPAAGTALAAKTAAPGVHLVAPGTTCPAAADTPLHPEPSKSAASKPSSAPAPRPKPTPTPAPTFEPEPEPEPSEEEGPADVYYKNCAAARAAGAAPVHRGDPGYGRHLDRDGDGVACE